MVGSSTLKKVYGPAAIVKCNYGSFQICQVKKVMGPPGHFFFFFLKVMSEKSVSSETQPIPDYLSHLPHGTCGPNATWLLVSDTLIVDGTGEMTNYRSPESVPWYSSRGLIKKIVIKDGITNVGDYAFSYCTAVTSVSFGNGIRRVGDHGFYQCSSLQGILLPSDLRIISNYAFANCITMTTVVQVAAPKESARDQ